MLPIIIQVSICGLKNEFQSREEAEFLIFLFWDEVNILMFSVVT